MRKFLFIVIAFLLTGANVQAQTRLNKFNVTSPKEIKMPLLGDSTNFNGGKFTLNELLRSPMNLDLKNQELQCLEADSTGYISLPKAEGESNLFYLLQTNLRAERFTYATLTLFSSARCEVFINGQSKQGNMTPSDTITKIRPITLKLRMEPEKDYQLTIKTVPEVADITAFLATNTTEAAKTDIYRITCPVTVIYQYDRYLYITDGTKSLQVYGSLNNTYTNGDVLEGICGSVGYYNGTYQMTPVVTSFGDATPGTAVQPATVTIEDITNDMVSDYIRITKVTVEQDKTFSDATGTIDAYKRFDVELPAVGADTYTVEGFVSNYKGTLQIFPTKITNTTALNATQAVAGRVYATNGYIKTNGNNETVSVYNVTGKLVATGMAGRDIKVNGKGIYIVKVGNKATKVVVR